MDGIPLAVALSLASAVCYAFGAVEQERVAARLGSRKRLLETFRFALWWFAVLLTSVGGALHLMALRYGPLTVVQPLGALSLVVALPLGALVGRHSVTAAEWRGAGMTVIGLAGLVMVTAPGDPDPVLDSVETFLITTVTLAALVGLCVVASRSTRSWVKGLLYGTASGVAFGVGAALSQVVAVQVSTMGLRDAAIQPVTLIILALAVAGILLSQVAYHSGLALPLAAITLANPVAASTIGLMLFGEGYTMGRAGVVLAAVSAVAAGYGVAMLARSSRMF